MQLMQSLAVMVSPSVTSSAPPLLIGGATESEGQVRRVGWGVACRKYSWFIPPRDHCSHLLSALRCWCGRHHWCSVRTPLLFLVASVCFALSSPVHHHPFQCLFGTEASWPVRRVRTAWGNSVISQHLVWPIAKDGQCRRKKAQVFAWKREDKL